MVCFMLPLYAKAPCPACSCHLPASACDALVPVHSRHNTLFAQTKPAFHSSIHCGCSTGKSFSQHLLCIYLSTGPIIPSHTGQRGGNTRLITPLPISFILFTNPPDCNIPICNIINKKATIHSCNAGTYHRPHGCLL